MKKILISVIIILLIVLISFALTKGIVFLNIKSIQNIKTESNKLENSFNEANELANKTYPEEEQGLQEAIKNLKIAKQEYESKNSYNTEDNKIGSIEVKTYKIHYLWTILGNYRKNNGIQSLTLDLKTTEMEDVYDLEFTLVGAYTNITEFLYDVENDEELNFEIKNFNIGSQTTNTEGNDINSTIDENNTNKSTTTQKNTSTEETKKTNDGYTLQAKFTVENIGITLD